RRRPGSRAEQRRPNRQPTGRERVRDLITHGLHRLPGHMPNKLSKEFPVLSAIAFPSPASESTRPEPTRTRRQPRLMPWQRAWRQGFAPLISVRGLESLRKALIEDDPRLVQGKTTLPVIQDDRPKDLKLAVEGACAIGFCGWQGAGRNSVGEVDDWFQ